MPKTVGVQSILDVRAQPPTEEKSLVIMTFCLPVFREAFIIMKAPFGNKIYKEVTKWQKLN